MTEQNTHIQMSRNPTSGIN